MAETAHQPLISHRQQATSDVFHLRTEKKDAHSPKARVEHDPRAPHVVFGGGEEAVFSQGHIADERQDEHGDAQDDQAQGLGGADHFGMRGECKRGVGLCRYEPVRPLQSAGKRGRHAAVLIGVHPPGGERRSGGCWCWSWWMRWPDA